MRLQPSLFPGAMNSVFADTQGCCKLAATPVCRPIDRFLARSRQNPWPARSPSGRWPIGPDNKYPVHPRPNRESGFDAPAFRQVVAAHFTLAVLYQKIGMNNNARKHLAIFLTDWHDADRDLPAYKAAERLSALIEERGMPTPAM